MLDEATVTINSDVADTCKLSVPNAILERFDLTASYSDNVLRIKGLARSKHYVTALSNVIFTPSKYSMKKSVELKVLDYFSFSASIFYFLFSIQTTYEKKSFLFSNFFSY